ncbi:Dps family protein [Oceanobacillus sp. CF4.6]|uniref:Dps family protein n=1 Tax=Oceanobacillus sp. CF4.6 TaxID=3373080 RepID=UPI003EE64B0E
MEQQTHTEHEHHHHHATAAFMVNHLIANQGVLNVKLHQFHWYIQGRDFFRLHEKFEELYNAVNQYYDQFAERMLAIGEKPYSTLAEYLEHAFISEKPYEKKMSSNEMVEALVGDYRTIRDVTIKAIELAVKEDDFVTEDMLKEYKANLDQTIWMLQAYLGNDALEGEEE